MRGRELGDRGSGLIQGGCGIFSELLPTTVDFFLLVTGCGYLKFLKTCQKFSKLLSRKKLSEAVKNSEKLLSCQKFLKVASKRLNGRKFLNFISAAISRRRVANVLLMGC